MDRFREKHLISFVSLILLVLSMCVPVLAKDVSRADEEHTAKARKNQIELGLILRLNLESDKDVINSYLDDCFGGAYRFGRNLTEKLSLELMYLDFENTDSIFNASRASTLALGAGYRLAKAGRANFAYRIYAADASIHIDYVDPASGDKTKVDFNASGIIQLLGVEVPFGGRYSWWSYYVHGMQNGDAKVDYSSFNMGWAYNF